MKFLKRSGKVIIYDIDDYYLDIPSYSFSRHLNFGHRKNTFIKNLQFADVVLASTPFLKKLLMEYNDNVVVIENTLGHYLFKNNEPVADTVKILITSNDNLKIINFKDDFIRCLIDLKKKYGNRIELIFLGKFSNIENIKKIADTVYDRMSPESYHDYLINNSIQIGIVPLGGEEDPETLETHSCKSNIKFLEFANYGIAGIYSNVEPYNFISNEKAGIIVNNNYEEWFNAIQTLVENSALCSEIVRNSHNMIKKSYMKFDSQKKLLNVLDSISINNKFDINRFKILIFSFFLTAGYKKDIIIQKFNFIILLIINGKFNEIYSRAKELIIPFSNRK